MEVVGEHMHDQICGHHREQRCHERSCVEERQGSRGTDAPLSELGLSRAKQSRICRGAGGQADPSMETSWQHEVWARARRLVRSKSGRSSHGEATAAAKKEFVVEWVAGRANMGVSLKTAAWLHEWGW
jgi:hypothetical protein